MTLYGGDIVTKVHRDKTERKLVFERLQDCEPIIESNKAVAADPVKRDWGRHIATIPNVILEKWIVEDGVNYLALPKDEFDRLIRRKLRDPDWAHLRTYTGNV